MVSARDSGSFSLRGSRADDELLKGKTSGRWKEKSVERCF